ncbi:adenylate cyclase type 2-like isoform X1 [Periplaneta americana]|uniref:adenylate cyclase type 2-like isoform X1 n=1 Tax=Periplaneta americana TaxID=6978 RepID=UPI0037E94620
MSTSGMEELFSRSSLNSVRHVSQTSNYLRETLNSQPTDDRNWWWGYLRRQFRLKNLEELYLKYLQRLHLGYFSVFVVLQSFLSVSHAGVLWALEGALPDAVTYCIITLLCWPLVVVVFRERLQHTFPCLSLLVSCLVVLLLLAMDLGLPLFHMSRNTDPSRALRPAYTTHTLLVCYVYLPLTENVQAFILGLVVSLCHILALGMVTYQNEPDIVKRLVSDSVYLICVNGLGLYFRLMSEVSIRRTFLDRRACLESNSKVEYEKQQEENLMLSIIPRHIIEDVRKDIQNLIQKINTPLRRKPFTDMYVKKHDNVTILYADVVKYAQLTVSLPVKKLVETLNELFGRFDEASEEHGVLRIKFLGDCYYCVSGVPEYNAQHARNCVDLGLDMISIIKEVREGRKLTETLDMRIGIHSGKILSGLLGVCKWQYDVWSHDVIIASNMEQAGRPGKVHVTKETLNLLGNKYKYIPGNGSSRNEILKKYNIETFFIVPNEKHSEERITEDKPLYNRRYSAGGQRRLTANKSSSQVRRSATDNLAVGSRRRFVFMDDNLYKYQQTLRKADEQMAEAIKNMHVGVYDRWLLREAINPLCLTFENIRWEIPFLKQPDPLFKFYVGCTLLVLLGMLAMQCLGLPSSHWMPWIGYGVSVGVIVTLLPLTWTHYIWNKYKDPHEEQDHIPEPRNKLLKLLYRASLKVVWSASTRTILYLVMCISLTVCTMLELIECDIESESMNSQRNSTEAFVLPDCLPPWHITQTCALTLIMCFLFLRIQFQLKLLLGILVVLTYSFGVWFLAPDIYEYSETWNPHLEPKIAHIMNVTFLTFTLHLMDRQAEYMNRLDYKWKRQLSKEQDESSTMHMINKMLLQNILPIHVADWFLNTNRDHEELYHEEYDTVAVIFASLTEYALWDDNGLDGANELSSIKLLNQIICDFDKLLFDPSSLRVEKIKVAGWTYMAACGLDPGRRDSMSSISKATYSEHVALVLTRFAVKMMGVLQNINKETFQTFKLRVGISHGNVTAGVIGAQKPHYDIWGHSVNMASRMESTGEPGKIQVTENTAKVLQELGIECECRGQIRVKSITNLVTTYYVHFDENFELIQTSRNKLNIEISDSESRDYEERYTEQNEDNTKL